MFDQFYFETLADVEEKLKYLKKCIDEADREKDYSEALRFRYMYIKESVFNGDCYKAVIMFPEYMALFDKHPDCHDTYSFMVAFKWIIENVPDFYQISSEMVETYFEEFRKRCEMYGYSLRTYYMKAMLFYADTDPGKAKKLLELFRQCERDSLSDCAACEMNHDIRMELRFGTEERALEMLNDMLSRGISCAEVPEVTYGCCVEHFTKIGAVSEGEHYADIAMPMIAGNENFLMEISHILLLKTITDPDKAFRLFTRYLSFFIRNRNPKMRFFFADAASRFFRSINPNDCPVIGMKLPKDFELYNEKGEYRTEDLEKYFYNIANEIAEKFDKRNGCSSYKDRLCRKYSAEPSKKLSLPEHGTVERTPYLLGIPLTDENSFPKIEEVANAINSIDDAEITNVYIDEESGSLVISVSDNKKDYTVDVRVTMTDINEDMLQFEPIHEIDFNGFADGFRVMLVVGAVLDPGCEGEQALLLMKIANKLNSCNSPLVFDLVNLRMLSTKWLDVTSRFSITPLDHYFYRIHIYREQDEDKFVAVTTGLSVFGSRQIFVRGFTEEQINSVCRIIAQISSFTIGVGYLRDEKVKAHFGVYHENRTRVFFSWSTPLTAYNDNENNEVFAVPYICLPDGAGEQTLRLDEITAEAAEKLTFYNSRKYDMNQYAAAYSSFGAAVEALAEEDILIAGVTVPIPETFVEEYGETSDVYARVTSVAPMKAVIVDGIDDIPELAAEKEIDVDKEKIFFWRIERNGGYYFPDDLYLL